MVKHGTRWNDTTGRWTTTDPITRLTDPNQATPYAYAADNSHQLHRSDGKEYQWM